MQARTLSMVALTLTLGAVMGWTAAAVAEDADLFRGSVRARSYVHSYKMPFDIGVDRDFKPFERVDEERTRVHVPEHYGEVIDISMQGEDALFWFRDGDGVIRNGFVRGATNDLLHIEAVPQRDLDVDFR